MQQVILDMDGVLADIYTQMINYHQNSTGEIVNYQDTIGLSEMEAFPDGLTYINEPGFFRTLPVIEDSIDGVKYLNDHYKLYIVSSAMQFPNSLREKYDWLEEHFPFLDWKQIVLCGSKELIKGDFMIDDHPKNLDFFEGEKIIFTQPHNQLIENENYKRFDHWNQIREIL